MADENTKWKIKILIEDGIDILQSIAKKAVSWMIYMDKPKILALVSFYTAKCFLRIDPVENVPHLEGITNTDELLLHFYVAWHKYIVVPFKRCFGQGDEYGFPMEFLTVIDKSVLDKLRATGSCNISVSG